jgi:hypothetical protein
MAIQDVEILTFIKFSEERSSYSPDGVSGSSIERHFIKELNNSEDELYCKLDEIQKQGLIKCDTMNDLYELTDAGNAKL